MIVVSVVTLTIAFTERGRIHLPAAVITDNVQNYSELWKSSMFVRISIECTTMSNKINHRGQGRKYQTIDLFMWYCVAVVGSVDVLYNSLIE